MELNFKTYGQGPALIILHGLFGSLDNWQTLARKYAEDFSVFIIDLRNHGKSPHSDVFDYPSMSEDIYEFMDAQSIPQASFIGHSMGGKVVMQFAMDHPERVEKLIVADMAPIQYPPHHQQVLEAIRSFPDGKLDERAEADELLQKSIPDFGVRMFLLKNLERDEQNHLVWKFNFPVIDENYDKILAHVEFSFPCEKPVLFIRGGKSDYVKDAYKPVIKNIFPHATFDTVEGAGHWLHAEKPEAFFKQTMAFLKA